MTDHTSLTEGSPDALAALALVPEQLPDYVRRVTGSRLQLIHGFALYESDHAAVLVAAPTAAENSLDGNAPDWEDRVDAAIAAVSARPGIRRLTVLGLSRPSAAPVDQPGYSETRDQYLALDLPFVDSGPDFSGLPEQKLRNMLRRAARDVFVAVEPWDADCQSLAHAYAVGRALEPGTRYIFRHLADYAAAPGVRVFTARKKADGTLQGVCLGDFTPLDTALYMFAFRQQTAVPGTADLLLHALVAEAQQRGHVRVNLGLSIHRGIGFFKKKWRARPFLPLVECSWTPVPPEQGLWQRLRRRFLRGHHAA